MMMMMTSLQAQNDPTDLSLFPFLDSSRQMRPVCRGLYVPGSRPTSRLTIQSASQLNGTEVERPLLTFERLLRPAAQIHCDQNLAFLFSRRRSHARSLVIIVSAKRSRKLQCQFVRTLCTPLTTDVNKTNERCVAWARSRRPTAVPVSPASTSSLRPWRLFLDEN